MQLRLNKSHIVWISALNLLSETLMAGAAAAGPDPVGFVKISIAGTTASPVTTLVSPSFIQPDAWSGALSSIQGTQIAVATAAANWAPGGFASTHYVEIASGDSAGVWTDIIGNAANSLTTNDDLAGMAAPGDRLVIRKFVTLQDFLGSDNRAGLHGAGTRAAADEVTIYEGGVPRTYWFYDASAGGTAEWRDAAGQPAGTVIIPPGQGIAIRRKAAGALTVITTGTVKPGPTYVAVQGANNVIDSLSPAGITLEASNLFSGDSATGVRSGSSPAAADEVVLYPASAPKIFWHYDGSQGGAAGWYDTSYQPADDVKIPAASSFAINRKDGASFFWVAPSAIP